MATETKKLKIETDPDVFDRMIDNPDHPDLVYVLGCGCSGRIPILECLKKRNNCKVCFSHLTEPESKNVRLCTSLLIRHYDAQQKKVLNILIDPSKTFNQAMKNLLSSDLYQKSKAEMDNLYVLLSHHHDDALSGLGDIREFVGMHYQDAVGFYSRSVDFERAQEQFPYLFDKSKVSKGSKASNFQYHQIEGYKQFMIGDLPILPLPCFHGEEVTCLGFKFGSSFVYCSDVNGFPYQSYEHLMSVEYLMIDCLDKTAIQAAHYCLPAVLKITDDLKIRKHVYFTGLGHNMDYDEINEMFQDRKEPSFSVCYDTQILDITNFSPKLRAFSSSEAIPEAFTVRKSVLICGPDPLANLAVHELLQSENRHQVSVWCFDSAIPKNFPLKTESELPKESKFDFVLLVDFGAHAMFHLFGQVEATADAKVQLPDSWLVTWNSQVFPELQKKTDNIYLLVSSASLYIRNPYTLMWRNPHFSTSTRGWINNLTGEQCNFQLPELCHGLLEKIHYTGSLRSKDQSQNSNSDSQKINSDSQKINSDFQNNANSQSKNGHQSNHVSQNWTEFYEDIKARHVSRFSKFLKAAEDFSESASLEVKLFQHTLLQKEFQFTLTESFTSYNSEKKQRLRSCNEAHDANFDFYLWSPFSRGVIPAEKKKEKEEL